MKKFKIIIVISIAILLSSCGTVKKGFSNQKNNSDEFLVEKKSQIVMTPDYNELPITGEEKVEKETKDIKSLILKSKQNENKENLDIKSSSFENSIIKKIKKN